jgi:hypothetical protein
VKKHHVIALGLAAVLVAGLVVDTVFAAVNGHHTFITDDTRGGTAVSIMMAALLGVAFAALAGVVRAERAAFAAGNRAVRATRPVLLVSLTLLALGQLVVQPVMLLSGTRSGAAYDMSGAAAGLTLVALFVAVLVLSVAVVRSNPLGVGGRILLLIVPAVAVTVLLALVAPAFASPVYCTAVALTGLSLIGYRSHPADTATQSRTGLLVEAPSPTHSAG